MQDGGGKEGWVKRQTKTEGLGADGGRGKKKGKKKENSGVQISQLHNLPWRVTSWDLTESPRAEWRTRLLARTRLAAWRRDAYMVAYLKGGSGAHGH